MSLKAKQRILKLRETEYKLRKLQDDLVNGNDNNGSASMTEFLSHHQELMRLPGSNRDSLPFRFSFEAPKRYVEMKQTQKLTLPPKIPAKSVNKIKEYKDPLALEEQSSSYKVGLAGRRSLALQTLLNELNQQTSKLALAFPKLDKHTLLNKAPFLRKLNRENSKGESLKKNSKLNKERSGGPAMKSLPKKPNTTLGKKLWNPPLKNGQSKKVKVMWNNELSEKASTTTELLFPSDHESLKFEKYQKNESKLSRPDSEDLRESVAYALGVGKSNLIGVILPSNSTQLPPDKRGPSTWEEQKLSGSRSTVGTNETNAENDESDSITVKEAVKILKKRKFPERKPPLPEVLAPHERGLVGVEISNFEAQCAFFYRDRNGNYNPHLHHSKNVTDSMKWGWNKNVKR